MTRPPGREPSHELPGTLGLAELSRDRNHTAVHQSQANQWRCRYNVYLRSSVPSEGTFGRLRSPWNVTVTPLGEDERCARGDVTDRLRTTQIRCDGALENGMTAIMLLKRILGHVMLGGLLAATFSAILYGAFWVRFEGAVGSLQTQLFWQLLPIVVVAKLTTFYAYRLHRGWGRYATFHDMLRLAEWAALSSLLIVLLNYMILPELQTPRSVFLMDSGTTLALAAGVRGLTRSLRERYAPLLIKDGVRALIVGANDTGEALLRTLRLNRDLHYRVIGFLDDSENPQSTYIGGVPVLGTLSNACDIARRHGVKEILLTTGAVAPIAVRKLMDECAKHSISIRMLPSYNELLSGNVMVQVRDVSIEDLLRREPVRLEVDSIQRWLQDRTILVTGSAGSIGSEICRQLLQFSPSRLVLVDQSENGQFEIERELRAKTHHTKIDYYIADILDQNRMRQVLQQSQADVIFHAAAYKHVPLMEANPGEAVKNNVVATRRLADLAEEFGLEAFVMISTDKAVNPTSVMGACKRVAELYVQSKSEDSQCRFVTVRFGNVLDSSGSVIPIFRDQIKRGGPVTITDPRMERFFMTIPEAAQLVIQAGYMGEGGEIFVLDMGKPVRILDLAHDMVRLSGLTVGRDIEIKTVGLRPGEKLYEELHVEGEEHLPTRHPKIVVAKCNDDVRIDIQGAIRQLEKIAEQPPQVVRAALKTVVPQYTPQFETAIPQPAKRAA